MTANIELVKQLHAAGALLFCWSSGGADYCRRSAAEFNLSECFQAFLPKPHALLDDVLVSQWGMLELHPNQCSGCSAAEILAAVVQK